MLVPGCDMRVDVFDGREKKHERSSAMFTPQRTRIKLRDETSNGSEQRLGRGSYSHNDTTHTLLLLSGSRLGPAECWS
jgi:hypothetical protein